MSKLICALLVQDFSSKVLQKSTLWKSINWSSKADQINEAIKTCQQDQGTKALDLIMEAGYPDLSKKDAAKGRTVLHNAVVAKVPLVVVQGLINRVKELEKSVSEYVNIVDKRGENALVLAAKNAPELFSEMASKCHQELKDALEEFSEYAAILPSLSTARNFPTAVELIKNADYFVLSHEAPFSHSTYGGTILHETLRHLFGAGVHTPQASTTLVRAILDRVKQLGKSVKDYLEIREESSGMTALQIAAEKSRNPQIVQLLIDVKADVNGNGGAISNALRGVHGDLDAVQEKITKILLDAGAEVNFSDLKEAFVGPLDVLASSLVIEAAYRRGKLDRFFISTHAELGRTYKEVLKDGLRLARWVSLPELDSIVSIVAEKIVDDLKNFSGQPEGTIDASLLRPEPMLNCLKYGHFKFLKLLLEKIPNYLESIPIDRKSALDQACTSLNQMITEQQQPSDGLVLFIRSMMKLQGHEIDVKAQDSLGLCARQITNLDQQATGALP